MLEIKSSQIKQILATIIIVFVTVFILYALLPYVTAFAGALILFVLLFPINRLFNKKLGKKTSAVLCIILSILIIVLPLVFLSNVLIDEVSTITKNAETMIKDSDLVDDFSIKFEKYTGNKLSMNKVLSETESFIKENVTKSADEFFRSVIHFVVSSIILYVTLFFLLINSNKFISSVEKHLPFNQKNSEKLMFQFVKVTRSTVIGEGLIAITQGILLGFAFYLFGIQGAIFWGFIGAILSFLPFVGVTLIWVPAGLYKLFIGDYFSAIGFILVCGIIITGSDYGLRPYFSKKFANIHPLITIIGIFMGIPYFGIFGILIGPLLLSYLFLLIGMYWEEYL